MWLFLVVFEMTNWGKCRLGNIAETNQKSLSINHNLDFLNYLDTGNITENRIDSIQHYSLDGIKIPSRAKRIVKQRDIIYSTVRPNQKHFGYIKGTIDNLIVSTGFTTITVDPNKADSLFVYYTLTQDSITNSLHAIAEQSVSAYPSIKPSDLEKVEVNLPPLPTQRKIAAILSAMDDKIENNRKTAEKLEEIAAAVFKRWFVDFEFPDEQGKPYKSSGGRMVESELGLTPEGWEITELGRLVEFSQGIQVAVGKQVSKKQEGYKRFIRIVDYTKNESEEPRYVIDKGERYYCSKNDITMVRYGASVGFVGRRIEGIIANNIFKIKPIDTVGENYLFYFMSSPEIQHFISSSSSGSAMPAITHGTIKDIQIALPRGAILKAFENLCSSIENIINGKTSENRNLQDARNALLPKLISGELRVEEVEV